MRRISFIVLLPLCAAAQAATLRPMGTLNGPVVHLSDLWDDAGPAGNRVLGPGPQPGGSITVGAAQLGAIAQAYGVAWQPHTDVDEAVLSRPGAPLPLAQVVDVLRPVLAAQGAGAGDASFTVALPLFAPPMLDAGVVPRLSVEQANFDVTSGRFAAVLIVNAGSNAPLRLNLAGNIVASVRVLVPTRQLLAGAIVGAGDLTPRLVPANVMSGAVAVDPAQAVGLQLRRMAFAGQPVPLADLARPDAVAKHDRVLLALAMPGLDVGAVGEALDAGAIGDQITVRNPTSGAVLSGQITGPDQVRIEPGTQPSFARTPGGFSVASR
jgi:flagella basal body P-ring formation protein FlgA